MNLDIQGLKAKITAVKVNNLDPNGELESVETNLTCHVSIQLQLSNKSLSMFDKNLIKAIYQKKPRKDSDPQEMLEIEDNFMPHLKFPAIHKIPWKAQATGYTFHLVDDRPISGDTAIMTDCTLNRVYIQPQEGGTISLTLDVHGNCQKEKHIANIFHYLKRDTEISLTPPTDKETNNVELEIVK